MQYSEGRACESGATRGGALLLALIANLSTGCALVYPHVKTVPLPVDVAFVPGCPSQLDGQLSMCQWRRVVWAEHLYALGVVRGFITSGDAVHSPYVEADALAAGLVALGVPEDVIVRERRALHTDQNVAYSLALLDEQRAADGAGARPVVVASDAGQASGMCSMVTAWRSSFPTVSTCISAPIDEAWTFRRLEAGVPDVRTQPQQNWLTLAEREAQMAAQTGHRRPPSFWVYTGHGFLKLFGLSRPPG